MSLTPEKPSILLIPGSFSPPTFYHRIVPSLQSLTYPTYPLPLPSCGERIDGPATFTDDVLSIRSAIQKLVDQGKDVVVAMNSYGGYPGTEASQGLGKKEREAKGEKGGIVGLVYLASFLPGVGDSLKDGMGEDLPESIRKGDDYMKLDYEEDWKKIFTGLPDDEAKIFMHEMPNHSAVSFEGKLTYPGYLHIPTTYVFTEEDKIITPENQQSMIEAAQKNGAKLNIVKLKTGHVPMLSKPKEVVDIIVQAAGGNH